MVFTLASTAAVGATDSGNKWKRISIESAGVGLYQSRTTVYAKLATETRYVAIGWRSCQWTNAVTPSSVDSSWRPLLAVIMPDGVVTRTSTESALSDGSSLHGHHVRASNGSLSELMNGVPLWVVNVNAAPNAPAAGVPWYVTVTSTVSPVLYALPSCSVSTPALWTNAVATDADVAASTVMCVLSRSMSSVVIGPDTTVATMRTVPASTLVVGFGWRSRP